MGSEEKSTDAGRADDDRRAVGAPTEVVAQLDGGRGHGEVDRGEEGERRQCENADRERERGQPGRHEHLVEAEAPAGGPRHQQRFRDSAHGTGGHRADADSQEDRRERARAIENEGPPAPVPLRDAVAAEHEAAAAQHDADEHER